MQGQAYALEGQQPGNDPVLDAAQAWLEDYFVGKRPEPARLPLNPKGTEFQKAVWRLLLEIPYGQVTTYGALAAKLAQERGGRMSAQAIGGAVGRNPISIIIPCHRVIGADGRLTGYAGGLWRKEALLRLEGTIKSE
jgi:methylated-DNA-[protein]-cysteine S-methyltransferase